MENRQEFVECASCDTDLCPFQRSSFHKFCNANVRVKNTDGRMAIPSFLNDRLCQT